MGQVWEEKASEKAYLFSLLELRQIKQDLESYTDDPG